MKKPKVTYPPVSPSGRDIYCTQCTQWRPSTQINCVCRGNRPMTQMYQCRACIKASFILRQMGFKDSFSWGVTPNSPNKDVIHAQHSNAVNSLCVAYRSELAWLSAGRPHRITVYMAAPVSPFKGHTFDDNVLSATRWFRYLRHLPTSSLSEMTGVYYEQRPLIQCPWLAGIETDELSPGGREGVLQDCIDTVRMFDEVWCMPPHVSDGMMLEGMNAPVVRDLTHLKLPPVSRPGQRARLNPAPREPKDK